HRQGRDRGTAVDQRERAAARAEVAVELVAHVLDLAAEDFLRGVAPDREEVETDPPGLAGQEAGKRVVEQRPLPGGVLQLSGSLEVAIEEGAAVLVAVRQVHESLAMELAVDEIALVPAAIGTREV